MFCRKAKEDIELSDRDFPQRSPLLPVLAPQKSYDYVLVGHKDEEAEGGQETQRTMKQKAFIEMLRKKNIKVLEIPHDDKLFYGLRAPNEVFEDYKYLLKVSDACNWIEEPKAVVPQSTRIRIVHHILHHTYLDNGEDLHELLKKHVFETFFCLHEKRAQKELRTNWARWSSLFIRQPFNEVKAYFGEKVALYYLWLDWYTKLLVPAAVLGMLVFLYGLAFFNSNPLIKEVCESDIIMCPRCDKRCPVWNLSDTCAYAKVSHLFDNEATVAFAMSMAIWATLFLELWKRQRAKHVSKWKVYDWCEEEEELILDIVNDQDCKPKHFRHSYLSSMLVLILVTLMLVVIIGIAHAIVVFRVVAAPLLSEGSWEFIRDHANTVAVLLGAVLHYLTIQIMTRVNRWVALKLCDLERTRSSTATERSFTVKMFTFQFFTLFSSLFYVAFFMGRINGYPGSYVRVAGRWRLEECHPSGCLTDLFIQMAVVMVLKQTLNNVFEFIVPWCKQFFLRRKAKRMERKCGHCYRKTCRDESGCVEPCDVCKLRNWLLNYHLADTNAFSLFNEFLEMVVQFSFTTIFVAAFPLAPLLALLNNIFEIRLDAIKMISLERRLVPKKTNDIGIWTNVLEAIGVLAVIANGLVIGISSDFIPRLLYRYYYGPCAVSGVYTNCMKGYIRNTLSTANLNETLVRKDFITAQLMTDGLNVTQCSYRDYRHHEDYTLTSQFWLILAVRFAFIILFEHVLVVCKFIAAWFVPNNPLQVKNQRLEDKQKRLKEELRQRRIRTAAGVNIPCSQTSSQWCPVAEPEELIW
ncbi:anoctamin-9 [Gadus macrocephalus]|uniref:anoctamin-9 n=1 Tax=Gadus macrocephalus TaxID=80720 RepID=UPI0028CB59DB|nr:anoctamin-9 [Gadus macrocephalus]